MLPLQNPGLLCYLLALASLIVESSAAPSIERLATFRNSPSSPLRGPLSTGADGYLWGATGSGGPVNDGTLFRVKADGSEWQSMFEFNELSGPYKGEAPIGGLLNLNGIFWGVTREGGNGDHGTIFTYNPATGALATVIEFTGNGSRNKGRAPNSWLLEGPSGFLWGATREGGTSNEGTVFKINPANGSLTTIVNFTDNGNTAKGANPLGALVVGPRGFIWGTTSFGGSDDFGTVYKINPSNGAHTTVVQFTASNIQLGLRPITGLTDDGAGMLWGTTYSGGDGGDGTIFRINPTNNSFSSRVLFKGVDANYPGMNPTSELVPDGQGNLWGTTDYHFSTATSDGGSAFRYNVATGTMTTMAVFNDIEEPLPGNSPWGTFHNDERGYMWATTVSGGRSDNGTVYRINIATGTPETVIDFKDGSIPPSAGLTTDGNGFLWGTSRNGGINTYGTIFKVNLAGGEATTVIEFTREGSENRGRDPNPGLVLHSDGMLWGSTLRGGEGDDGTIFKLHPATGVLTTVKEAGDGPNPNSLGSPLTPDTEGNFWGFTVNGDGSIYKFEPDTGDLRTVVIFRRRSEPFGAFPTGRLVPDGSGWLWGTTRNGGPSDYGTIFKLNPVTEEFITVATISNADRNSMGSSPTGAVAIDDNGFLWASNESGGIGNAGGILKLNMSTGALTPVALFGDSNGVILGSRPEQGLIFDGRRIWGTSSGDVFFAINPATNQITTQQFISAGQRKELGATFGFGGLYLHTDGHIYNVTTQSGPGGKGTLLRLRIGPIPETRPASEVTAETAVLSGTVDPRGSLTSVLFEYSKSPDMADSETVAVGSFSGNSVLPVQLEVDDLDSVTTYFFRIIASNPDNPNPQIGETLIFRTEPHSPVANPDPGYRVVEDNPLSANRDEGVLANDTDKDSGNGWQNLTAELRDDTTHGTLIFRPDGSFDYTPNPNYFGPDSFTYVASDGANISSLARVDIEVTELVDLRLTSAESRDVVGAPGSLTHTLEIQNLGPSNAGNIVLDLEFKFLSGVTRDLPELSTGTLTGNQWTLNLAENERATLSATYRIGADASGGVDVITTGAMVNGVAQPLTNQGDDETVVRSSIISPSDLELLAIDVDPVMDFQSGLFIQRVTVTNNNPLALAGFQLLIADLPGGIIVSNSHVTTEDGFLIESNSDLGAGESVTFKIEFFRPNRDPDFSVQYSIPAAYSEDPVTPPPAETGASPSRMTWLDNGDLLLDFDSTSGDKYAIEYSPDMQAWIRVVPTITAVNNRTQWIDSGPPKTETHPSKSPARYYRIVTLSEP